VRPGFTFNESTQYFEQELKPIHRLLIIGAEHDAVQMCLLASGMGMEVTVVTSIKDPRSKSNFPGATKVIGKEPDGIHAVGFDAETAVILMTHNYSRDFQFTLSILKEEYSYFGIIGSTKRKNMLLDELIQYSPDADLGKLETISSPAGLDIGSVTPQEIAVSVLAEMVVSIRKNDLELLNQSNSFINKN
jgi:xanthine/CO dehydrogenase XdhC/CoxF family maturation factor